MSIALFGTDGVRGTPGSYPLDATTIARLGAALARDLGDAPRVLIGRDTRASGDWIERQVAAGVTAAGGMPVTVGVMPTPGVAYLTSRGFDAGVVVSASHNPSPDNGVKVLTATGEKASRVVESRLASRVAADTWEPPAEAPSPPREAEAADAYVRHLTDIVAGVSLSAAGPIAIDCANGATSAVAPRVLRTLGMPFVELCTQPDGRNINADCGSTHPDALQRAVVEHRCRLGFAFDGDGDRVILVDHRGAIVDGDGVLYVCARHRHATQRLTGDAIVATVMSNIGLDLALEKSGIAVHRCPVGDWHVGEEMQRRGVCLGGEQSGHVIFSERLPTGDGMATALEVLRIVVETGRDLAELTVGLEVLPQVLVNVRVAEQRELDGVPPVRDVIRDAEERLGDRGRVLVRYSGTEPLLRIMIEGPEPGIVQELARSIEALAREHLA